MSAADKNDPGEGGESSHAAVATKIRSGVLVGIFVLLILYTAYFARAILIPMALAFLFSLILAPAVAWLARVRIPRPVGAAFVIALLMAGFGFGAYGLSGPALHWIQEAPAAIKKLEGMIHTSQGALGNIQQTAKEVKKATRDKPDVAERAQPVKIVGGGASIMDQARMLAPDVLTGVGIALVLLYFLLAASDSFLRSLAHAIPRWRDKRHAVEVARNIQRHISRYLFTITVINIAVGVVDGFALWLIGMPNPVLWGAMIAVFNYVPYLGALTALIILFLLSLITFNHVGVILAVPATIFAVSVIEGQFVTPHVVGRRLALSPVAVFVTLVVWGWLWGIVGAIIAVPLLACFKLMCEEIEPLHPISDFLTSYYGHKE